MDFGLPNLNNQQKEEGLIMLRKDKKVISRVRYLNSPFKLPDLSIDIEKSSNIDLSGLPHFLLHPASNGDHETREWGLFTDFLRKNNKLARVAQEMFVLYILPPDQGTDYIDAIVFYRIRNESICHKSDEAVIETSACITTKALTSTACAITKDFAPLKVVKPCAVKPEATGESLHENSEVKNAQTSGPQCDDISSKLKGPVEKNYAQADPSYLETLGQTHDSWIFGAIAELVDNSRDAKATKLEISMTTLRKDGKDIPMLSVIDDGYGMSHQEIVRMLSLGRKAPVEDDPTRIGRFGIGFKTGSMRLGRDAIVFTQTTTSRSVGFLSQSLNENKDMLEIPIVSYCREGLLMELDTSIHTEETAKHNLRLIMKFSGFNKYSIGALFPNNGTGTKVYIWNLDEWESECCLEVHDGKGTVPNGDIYIRSQRIRRRPGQISQKVPLDYSLRSYLEVIFLDPRMKVYVQGSVVKTRPLAKTLNKTAHIKGDIMGKSVQLTLGRSQLEWEQRNCGIFLYWHGRLIEAYKRVGGMAHNADMGRGVIGVIDVTDLMNDGKRVLVHNNKQGFQDCEAYAKLEDWLGHRADEYWDNNFDKIQVKKTSAGYEPDYEWVQCDKCRKWRILCSGYSSKNIPLQWFCQMPPFNGLCELAEEQMDHNVITVGAKRFGCETEEEQVNFDGGAKESSQPALYDNSDCSSQTQEKDILPTLKRLRRGPCKKAKRQPSGA